MRNRWWSVLVAIVPLMALALLNDPSGYLGTDTGGKAATLEAMVSRGDWSPDVGYWAAELDPEGQFHPLYGTSRADAGWVQVTSLPMIYAARPLWSVGGYRAALLLPMAGTLAAALAAAALVERFREPQFAPLAFWSFAFASPLLVYALDLWEHSIGVAALGWASVLVYDHASGRRGLVAAGAAGALCGVAATMRTEALVYTLVLVGVVCLVRLRRSALGAVATGAVATVGFTVVWSLNRLLEEVVGSTSRADRAAGIASTAGAGAGARLEEGLRTTFGSMATSSWTPVIIGAWLALVTALVVARWGRLPDGWRRPALILLASGTVLTVMRPLGFVPGLFPAFPLAAAALAVPRTPPAARVVTTAALAALPVVWAFQYLGGAGPQWGGRYTLPSAFALGVVGVVALTDRRVPRLVGATVLAMSFTVTMFGAAWLSERSHDIARVFEVVDRTSVPAVIGRNPFFLREAGPRALDRRWLSAEHPADLQGPAEVLRQAGIERFGVLQARGKGVPGIEGAVVRGTTTIPALGGAFEIVEMEFGVK